MWRTMLLNCIFSFQDDGDGEGWEDDEDEDVRGRVALNDPWWDDKISDDEDVFEVNYDVNSVGPSTYECVEGDRENGDGDGFKSAGVEGRSGPSTSQGRSDILLSPPISDDDSGEISSNLGSEFHTMDLVNPSLKLKMKFSTLQLFREAVKQYNVQRDKDIQFVKKWKSQMCCILKRSLLWLQSLW
jgi:hypothetical protein